jgi:hypothetical protein
VLLLAYAFQRPALDLSDVPVPARRELGPQVIITSYRQRVLRKAVLSAAIASGLGLAWLGVFLFGL